MHTARLPALHLGAAGIWRHLQTFAAAAIMVVTDPDIELGLGRLSSAYM